MSVTEVLPTQETSVSLRLRIPAELHEQPILSSLVRGFNLHLNIESAQLSATDQGSGWFHVTLQGDSEQIKSALHWLENHQIDIWSNQSHQDW